VSEEKFSPWPKGYQGAISLTFDDGLPSQLRIGAPLLNDYRLRGTFYIAPKGDNWEDRLAPWRQVAQFGHEIGNHSLSHICSCNFSGDPYCHGLENVSLEEIESDILEAQRRLEKAFPSQKNWTFAYPCYQSFVGRGKRRQSYVPIVANHFTAARGLGEGISANSPLVCDLHYLWSWPAQRMSGTEMIGLVEQATAQGRWGILTFHGINEGHLPVSEVDLKEMLSFLDRNRDRIWTAPMIQVAQHVINWYSTVQREVPKVNESE
jgi:peptidoglycan/xylan/chitin deacetylase (PgdA/CDA1 family)